MIVVRKLAAVATVVMTLTLVARTSSTAPSPKSSASWTGSFVAALVTSTKTVSRADLSRFAALAHKGLREPLEAAYRFDPPLDSPTGQLRSFRVWHEPVVGSGPEGNFVHETPFGQGTFRFIKNGRGKYYECLRAAPRRPWRCVGPFGPQSIGQGMQVEGYRLPMWVAENLTTGLPGPLVLFQRTALGRRLWCLNIQAESSLCARKQASWPSTPSGSSVPASSSWSRWR